jgi:hypothetical protein
MKRDNVKSQKGPNNKKSGTARTLGSARVCQPSAVYLTCSEGELEVLMSKGESS